MDKETRERLEKVEDTIGKLDKRTSSLVLIGPGENGYLHEKEARQVAGERVAEEFAKELEKMDIEALKRRG